MNKVPTTSNFENVQRFFRRRASRVFKVTAADDGGDAGWRRLDYGNEFL
jgi:hypothetical protein